MCQLQRRPHALELRQNRGRPRASRRAPATWDISREARGISVVTSGGRTHVTTSASAGLEDESGGYTGTGCFREFAQCRRPPRSISTLQGRSRRKLSTSSCGVLDIDSVPTLLPRRSRMSPGSPGRCHCWVEDGFMNIPREAKHVRDEMVRELSLAHRLSLTDVLDRARLQVQAELEEYGARLGYRS